MQTEHGFASCHFNFCVTPPLPHRRQKSFLCLILHSFNTIVHRLSVPARLLAQTWDHQVARPLERYIQTSNPLMSISHDWQEQWVWRCFHLSLELHAKSGNCVLSKMVLPHGATLKLNVQESPHGHRRIQDLCHHPYASSAWASGVFCPLYVGLLGQAYGFLVLLLLTYVNTLSVVLSTVFIGWDVAVGFSQCNKVLELVSFSQFFFLKP